MARLGWIGCLVLGPLALWSALIMWIAFYDWRYSNQELAQADLDRIVAAIESYRLCEGRLPPQLRDLTRPDANGHRHLEGIPDGPRQTFFRYRADRDGRYVVYTLGRDGAIGGRGKASDGWRGTMEIPADRP